MDGGRDIFGALTWGLRKYAWVIALSVLAIGVLVPLALSRVTPVYQAEALVAPNRELAAPNVDVLPRFGESVFSTNDGEVAYAVREEFDLAPDTPVIPQRVELVTEQDNFAMTVIGRSADPDDAALLANTAAATFQLQLNQTSDAVAYYIVSESAKPPIAPEPQFAGGIASLVVGILGGLIIGLALVVLIVVLRRPVLDAEAAQDATGAPVLGRLTIPGGRGEVTEGDVQGLGGLGRRLLASSTSAILLVGPPKAAALRHRLTPALTALLNRSRRVVVCRGGELDLATQGNPSGGDSKWGQRSNPTVTPSQQLVLVDGPTPEERLTRPDSALVLLVVPEGIGLKALSAVAEEYLDGGPGGVVLVRKRALHHRLDRERTPRRSSSPDGLNDGGRQHDEGLSVLLADQPEADDRTASASDAETSAAGVRSPGRS